MWPKLFCGQCQPGEIAERGFSLHGSSVVRFLGSGSLFRFLLRSKQVASRFFLNALVVIYGRLLANDRVDDRHDEERADGAKRSPPMTARPIGAFCSPPCPSASAMGNIPRIMANAVMQTGRRRVRPASSAASRASLPPNARRSRT
jgi:hypothetical protein